MDYLRYVYAYVVYKFVYKFHVRIWRTAIIYNYKSWWSFNNFLLLKEFYERKAWSMTARAKINEANRISHAEFVARHGDHWKPNIPPGRNPNGF